MAPLKSYTAMNKGV